MAHRPIRFSVPDSEVPALRVLARTAPELYGRLQEAFSQEGPTLDLAALASSVANRMGVDAEKVTPLVSGLWRLSLMQQDLELDAGVFVDRVCERLREKAESTWAEEDAEALDRAKGAIAQILASASTIGTSAKAGGLLLEQERVFCRSRIITDLRPVFDEQAEGIQAYLPFHTLVIGYHEGREHREMHVAMDTGDILRLRKHLDRALRKEKLLSLNLADAGFALVQTESQADD